jgi:hypothetical protein
MRKRFARVLTVACAVLAASAASAQTIEYAYTPLDTAKCRHVPSKEPEDYGHWTCKGYGSVTVWVAGGDQRMYISFGPRARNELAARQTLSAFNSEGKTIEWRLVRGGDGRLRPFATILRWNTTVTNDSGNPVRGQVLVVTSLPPGGVCHVGYVDGRANPNANDLAREIADKHARSFRCGKDKPITLGATGPGFSGPYDN